MQAAQRIAGEPGIRGAAAVMGTEANRKLLTNMGYALGNSRPRARTILSSPSTAMMRRLASCWKTPIAGCIGRRRRAAKSRIAAWRTRLPKTPRPRLRVISVPGEYAAAEARKALACDLNVFLFSSNVTVEDELSLKRDAQAKD